MDIEIRKKKQSLETAMALDSNNSIIWAMDRNGIHDWAWA